MIAFILVIYIFHAHVSDSRNSIHFISQKTNDNIILTREQCVACATVHVYTGFFYTVRSIPYKITLDNALFWSFIMSKL